MNTRSHPRKLVGSALSLVCCCSAAFADCTTVAIAGEHNRGWRMAVAPGALVFGVAGDAFAEPAVPGVAHVFSVSPELKLAVSGKISLPASSAIEIAASGSFIVIGLPGADTATRGAKDPGVIQRGSAQWAHAVPVRRAGRVLVWSRGSSLQSPRQFVSARPAEFSGFGAALVLDGARLAVGSPQEDKRGAVYVYDLDSPAQSAQRIAAPAGLSGFGTAVSLWDQQLFIGAPEQCCKGYVLSFRRSDSGWVESKRIANPLPATNVTYGQSLARGTNFLLVAGNGTDSGDGAPEPGAIDVFHTSELSASAFTRLQPRGTETAAFGRSGTAVAAGDRIFVNEQTAVLRFVAGLNRFSEDRRVNARELGVPAVYQLVANEHWVAYGHFQRGSSGEGGIWTLCTAAL